MKKQLILFLWAIILFTACETKSNQQNKETESSTPTIINLLTFEDVTKDTVKGSFEYSCKVQYTIINKDGNEIYKSKEFDLLYFRNDAVVSIDFSKLTGVNIKDDNRIAYNIKFNRKNTKTHKDDTIEIKSSDATFGFDLFIQALSGNINPDNKNNITVQKVTFDFNPKSTGRNTLPGDINPPIKPRETP